MFDDEKGGRIPNDFWDISSLIPKKNFHVPVRPAPEAVEIELPSRAANAESRPDTVIERTIPQRGTIPRQDEYTEVAASYTPANSLIHEVTVRKRKSSYPFYEEFYRDAVRLASARGERCEYVPFFSYSPQYNQLNEQQLAYYLWWRENARKGVWGKTDYSYILLYVYELINLGATADTAESLRQLTALWNEYHASFPSLHGKLSAWICDFGLIHGLPPAENATSELVRQTSALMEYYIAIPDGDTDRCVSALLKYCTAYDYHTSKFAKDDHLPLFDLHVREALKLAVEYFSEDGKMLSGLAKEDSTLTREAYAGALCAAREKYRVSVRYCSFSRTNELRYLVGDIIKYSENKLRAWLGVKSRLSVYSLSGGLQAVLDSYFAQALAKPRTRVAKKEEKHAYDVLYDLPLKPFSLTDAQKIEQESWETTNELLAAFDEDGKDATDPFPAETLAMPEEPSLEEQPPERNEETVSEEGDFCSSLGELAAFARAVWARDGEEQRREAARLGKLPDAIVDEINSKAFDVLGDILIDEGEDGWEIIDCYRDVFTNGGDQA